MEGRWITNLRGFAKITTTVLHPDEAKNSLSL